MSKNLNVRLDCDYKEILDNIALENGFASTSEFVRNNIYEIIEDYIDVQDYKKIMSKIEKGTEKTYTFDEVKDLLL